MERMLPRLTPGLEWIRREIVDLNGRRSVHFEFTTFAVDTDLRNHMYLTEFDGKMLGGNMNSTVEAYPSIASAFSRSRDSLRVAE